MDNTQVISINPLQLYTVGLPILLLVIGIVGKMIYWSKSPQERARLDAEAADRRPMVMAVLFVALIVFLGICAYTYAAYVAPLGGY